MKTPRHKYNTCPDNLISHWEETISIHVRNLPEILADLSHKWLNLIHYFVYNDNIMITAEIDEIASVKQIAKMKGCHSNENHNFRIIIPFS